MSSTPSDADVLIEYARTWAGFVLEAEQARAIAAAFAGFERNFRELSTDDLRDAEPPLVVVPGMHVP